MRDLAILGAIVATVIAASLSTDHTGLIQESTYVSLQTDIPEPQVDTILTVVRMSDTLSYEYPSMEDASIVTDIAQDSLVHYIMFQEKPGGDVYTIR
jgi:hypothetical protein